MPKKQPPASFAALRGVQLALCMADDAIGAGWDAKAQDRRDLQSAHKWMMKAFAARST